MVQSFLSLVSQHWKRNPLQVAEDMLHFATLRCNLQRFKKIHAVITESRTKLRCKPRKIARQVLRGHAARCNLLAFTSNAIATQVAKRLLPCNTSCRARFYFLQELFETIASCSSTLQCVTCLLQFAMDFFPTLQDNLQGK